MCSCNLGIHLHRDLGVSTAGSALHRRTDSRAACRAVAAAGYVAVAAQAALGAIGRAQRFEHWCFSGTAVCRRLPFARRLGSGVGSDSTAFGHVAGMGCRPPGAKGHHRVLCCCRCIWHGHVVAVAANRVRTHRHGSGLAGCGLNGHRCLVDTPLADRIASAIHDGLAVGAGRDDAGTRCMARRCATACIDGIAVGGLRLSQRGRCACGLCAVVSGCGTSAVRGCGVAGPVKPSDRSHSGMGVAIPVHGRYFAVGAAGCVGQCVWRAMDIQSLVPVRQCRTSIDQFSCCDPYDRRGPSSHRITHAHPHAPSFKAVAQLHPHGGG